MNEIIIGNKIAEGRKKMGFSQAQFAEILNISPQAVSKWERGESLPDVIMLSNIANTIGVDMNHFFSEPNNKKEDVQSGWVKNMSFASWKNADFSGFSSLEGKMSYANIEQCKFVDADLRGITFKANNIDKNDFTNAQMSSCKFLMANVKDNNFENANLTNIETNKSNINKNNFSGTNFSKALFKYCNFDENNIAKATFQETEFDKCEIKKTTFSGKIVNSSFIHCGFKKTEFVDVIFKDVFFKGKVKGAIFTNCKADKITFEFLKAAGADMAKIIMN